MLKDLTSEYGRNDSRDKLKSTNKHQNRNHLDNSFSATQRAGIDSTKQNISNGEIDYGNRNSANTRSSKFMTISRNTGYEGKYPDAFYNTREMPKNFNKERLNFGLTNSHNTQFTQNSKAEGHHTRIEKNCTCQPIQEKMKNDQTCIGFSTNSGDISDLNNMQSANVHCVENSPSKADSLHSMTNKGYVNQGVSSTINERGKQSIRVRPCLTIKSTAAKYYHDDQTPPPYCTGYSTSESLRLADEWNCKCFDCLSDKDKIYNSRSFSIHENDHLGRSHRPKKYRSRSRSRCSHSFYQREWSSRTKSPPYPSYTRKSRSRKSVPTMSNVRKSNSPGSITNRSRSHESISNRSSPHMSPSSRSTSRESTCESWSDSSWSGSFESTQSKFTSCTPLPSGSETQRSRKSYCPGRWRSWGSQSTASDYNRRRERGFNRKWGLQAQHSQLANKSSRGSRDGSKLTNPLCTTMGIYRKIMYNNRTAAQNWRKGKGYKNGRTFSHKRKNNEGYGPCNCNEIVSCNDFQPLTEDLRRIASDVNNIQDFLKEVKYLSSKTSKLNAAKNIHHSDQEGNNKAPKTDTVNYDDVEGFSESESETLSVESKSDVFLRNIEDFTISSCLNSNHLQDTIEKKTSIPKESHTISCPNVPSEPDRVSLAEDTICPLEDDLSGDITTPASMSNSLDVNQPTNVIGSKEDEINSCGVRESSCDVTETTEGQSSDCLTRDCIMKSATTVPAEEYNSIEERFAILNNKEVETILTLISFTESPDDSQEKATTNLFNSSCTESAGEDDDCESNSSFPLFELDSSDIFKENETNEWEVIKGNNNNRGMLTTQGANTIKEPLSKINISDDLKLTEEQLLTKKALAIRECSVVLKDKIPKRKPSVNRRVDRETNEQHQYGIWN
ncbi:hypothetical protein Pmani_012156 [Petrolisthes manimaculis]|uniref:Uncharacterized protein n=1 Tax=Petrolisthes manimaculis TaxID=1843537 RepID=A0AAE1PXN5_9EUCA|nr:hypothetical protein Pmani_012156 [Petrolisthes manimaculis]